MVLLRNAKLIRNCEACEGEDGMNAYILKRELGENRSLYHKTVVESIFHDILQKPIHVSNTESILTLKI